MLGTVDGLQREGDRQPVAFDSLDKHYQSALNLINAPQTKKAFEIDAEDVRLRDRYGRNRFGQSCLLARRLIESGVRFVTVSDPGWDTHANNFESLKNSLMPRVDQAVPALLTDLEDRGMLDSTLVVWLTDFGRTPKINSANGRDHWASAGFAIMAGAGIPGGSVIGRTDREGGVPADARPSPRTWPPRSTPGSASPSTLRPTPRTNAPSASTRASRSRAGHDPTGDSHPRAYRAMTARAVRRPSTAALTMPPA